MLDCERFPGFRAAFDPAEIKWDMNPSTIMQATRDVCEGARHRTMSKRVKALYFFTPGRPLNEYGVRKLRGECLVKLICCAFRFASSAVASVRPGPEISVGLAEGHVALQQQTLTCGH